VGTPDCPTGDNSSFPVSQPLSLPRIFFLPRAPIPILFLLNQSKNVSLSTVIFSITEKIISCKYVTPILNL
jgi:hypothetical protein